MAPLLTLPRVTPLGPQREAGLHRALAVAESSADHYSGAWWDQAAGAVVLGVAPGGGESVARAALSGSGVVIRPVKHSTRALFAMTASVLATSKPWAGLIDGAGPDPGRDAVRVDLNTISGQKADALRRDLWHRYGDAVYVVRSGGRFTEANRQTDSSPFYGGGRIGSATTGVASTAVLGSQCTSAFAWRIGLAGYMLTAGHCYRDGTTHPWSWTYTSSGSTAKVAHRVGLRVASTIGSNGDSKSYGGNYYGDIGLINVSQYGADVTGELFNGIATTTAHLSVAGQWSTYPAVGDRYCTSGSTTGSICNWTVTQGLHSVTLSSGDVMKWVVTGHHASGACIAGGDSGGAIYTINSAGKAVAKGIIGGKSDNILPGCYMIFTPIQYASIAFGGSVDAN